jgi:hypothetical protein
MGLSLLTPAALAIALLAALPILAHLAKQVPRERRAFGAMLLLERVVKRLRRRRRLKDPLLLLMRVLAILATVLAVTGARWTYPGGVPEFGGSGRVVVVLDRSASMALQDGGASLLQRAQDEAVRRVRELPEGTLVAAVAYGDEADRLVPALTADKERVIGKLGETDLARGTSDLRAALLEARRLLQGEPGEVFVFTDEAGSEMIPAAVSELKLLVEGGSAVIPFPVHADPPRNVAVVAAKYGDGVEGGQVEVTVANFGPDPVEAACEVTLPDGQAIPFFAEVPPQAEAQEKVTVPTEARGGVGKAWCEDRDLPLDDARFFHLPRVGASRVLVVDGDPGDTPVRSEVYFLERALSPWGGMRAGVKPDVTTPAGLMGLDPEVYRVVFLANVADPRSFGPLLTEFVRKGGNVVIGLGHNVSADRYNAALSGVLPAELRKVRDLADPEEPGVALELPDIEHKLFAPFARGGRAGFGRVRSHRVMTLDEYKDNDEISTLLRYEGGLPALIERRIGDGRVLLWTSTLDVEWTNLPLQSVYMPLLQRMVGWLGGESGGGEGRFDATVGEMVSIPLPDLAIEPDVFGPDGEKVRSRIDGSSLLFLPEKAGAYRLEISDAPTLAWVAVNSPAEESDVRRYDSIAKAEQEIDPELFLRHVDLSPWLFLAGFVLLVLQALAGARGSEASS